MIVWMVIDDYTPDTGSTIYGIFKTQELAEAYVATGLQEDYGEDTDRIENADIRLHTLIGA